MGYSEILRVLKNRRENQKVGTIIFANERTEAAGDKAKGRKVNLPV